VRGVEGLAELAGEARHILRRERPTREARAQRLPGHELEHEVEPGGVALEPGHGAQAQAVEHELGVGQADAVVELLVVDDGGLRGDGYNEQQGQDQGAEGLLHRGLVRVSCAEVPGRPAAGRPRSPAPARCPGMSPAPDSGATRRPAARGPAAG
jgi:hypothetical protein